MEVRARGGRVIVQAPSTAAAPFLPVSACRALVPDAVLVPSDIAAALSRLATPWDREAP